MNRANNFNTHLVDVMRSLGYLADKEGVCHGYACMWVQAVLSGETDNFIRRCQLIARALDFKKQIELALDQSKRIAVLNKNRTASTKISLPQDVQDWIDVQAFLEGIQLYQAPEMSINLFDELYRQDESALISRVAASNKMQEQGDLTKFYHETMVVNEKELLDYLSSLATLLSAEKDHQVPTGIMCCGFGHAISVQYDVCKKQWRLIDANHLEYIDRWMSTEAMADVMMRALFSKTQLLGVIMKLFAMQPALAANPALVERFREFNTSRTITAEMISRKSTSGATLAYLAARSGDAVTLRKIAQAKLPLNDPVVFVEPNPAQSNLPLILSVISNNPEAVKVFAENKIDLYQSDNKGQTPAYVAAYYGNAAMLKLLTLYGVNFDDLYEKEGMKYVHAATLNERWEAAAFILAHMAADKVSLLDLSGFAYTSEVREKLTAGFIKLLNNPDNHYRQLAQDVIDGKNALGKLLNTFSIPFSSFFTDRTYQDRKVTGSIAKIVESLEKLPVNEDKDTHSRHLPASDRR